MVEEEKAEVRGGGEGIREQKQPLHALNFLVGLLHLNSLEQAVREAFKSNFWKNLGFRPNWGGGGLPIPNFYPIFPEKTFLWSETDG